MTENTFFDSIITGYETTEEKVISILKARGFLIAHEMDGFYLSDNSAHSDAEYLSYGMEKFHLGTIENILLVEDESCGEKFVNETIRIRIDPSARIEDVISFFKDRGPVKLASCFYNWNWSRFSTREHGEKTPVEQLEAFVSYYVKAASACGVYTNFSCDGNHAFGGTIVVGADYPFDIWHRLIWENCIESLPFIGDGIRFSNETQFSAYYKIYRIADWLYNNRIAFRELKKDVFRNVTHKWLRKQDNKILEKWFCRTCDFSSIPKFEV